MFDAEGLISSLSTAYRMLNTFAMTSAILTMPTLKFDGKFFYSATNSLASRIAVSSASFVHGIKVISSISLSTSCISPSIIALKVSITVWNLFRTLNWYLIVCENQSRSRSISPTIREKALKILMTCSPFWKDGPTMNQSLF